MTATPLLDHSPWVRLGDVPLTAERADAVADWLESGRIATCPPLPLRADYSARTARKHDQLLAELLSLPHYGLTRLPSSAPSTRKPSFHASDITGFRRWTF